jgi:hypothetical protein
MSCMTCHTGSICGDWQHVSAAADLPPQVNLTLLTHRTTRCIAIAVRECRRPGVCFAGRLGPRLRTSGRMIPTSCSLPGSSSHCSPHKGRCPGVVDGVEVAVLQQILALCCAVLLKGGACRTTTAARTIDSGRTLPRGSCSLVQ